MNLEHGNGPGSPTGKPGLIRGLGRIESTCVVAGGIVGTTIFLIPSDVAGLVGSPFLAMLTWLLAGLLAGAAALCFAELSAAMPSTGGTYVFLRKAYGSDIVLFGFAWMMCFAYGSGAMAIVAIMAARYFVPVLSALGLPVGGMEKVLGVSMIVGLVVLNALGVRQGGWAQTLITIVKLSLLIAVIIVPLAMIRPLGNPLAQSGGSVANTLTGMTDALILCLFSYSGAYFVTHVAGEVKEPTRTIPKAIVNGFAIVLGLYLAVNLVFLAAIPFDELVGSQTLAADIARSALGIKGGLVVSAAISISAIGMLNAQLLNYPRIPFALSRDGLFFNIFGRIDPVRRVPRNAIVLMGLCACAYVMTGSYSEILGYVAFVSHFFISLAVLSTLLLRRREPEMVRPFRVWGYPWTPTAFLLVSLGYLGILLIDKFEAVAVGIVIVLSGVPFYFYWKIKRQVVSRTKDRKF